MAVDDSGDGLAFIYASGCERWPAVRIDPVDLAAYAQQAHLSTRAVDQAKDVFLACACIRGDASAILELERLLAAHLPAFISRIDGSKPFVDEVHQRLRERLLATDPPKLARYSGAGPLLGWLRVVAIRAALDLKRSSNADPVELRGDIVDRLAQDGADLEMDLLRTQYRVAFEEALAVGVARLSARHRAILRLYLLGGLNIDEIGSIYKVHRSTIARWITASERTIFDAAKSHLRERHRLSTTDLGSIARLLRSQLHLSLDRLLRS